MPDEEQEGQECSEGQEEEARAEQEMQEDLTCRAERYGATCRRGRGSKEGRSDERRPAQVGRGASAVVQEGPTAEEKKRDDLEKAALCRGRTEADRQFREQAAVGLEAAKRDEVGIGRRVVVELQALYQTETRQGEEDTTRSSVHIHNVWDEGRGTGIGSGGTCTTGRRET